VYHAHQNVHNVQEILTNVLNVKMDSFLIPLQENVKLVLIVNSVNTFHHNKKDVKEFVQLERHSKIQFV
jgi:hypothetical protein